MEERKELSAALRKNNDERTYARTFLNAFILVNEENVYGTNRYYVNVVDYLIDNYHGQKGTKRHAAQVKR
jgi:hypothetical protein